MLFFLNRGIYFNYIAKRDFFWNFSFAIGSHQKKFAGFIFAIIGSYQKIFAEFSAKTFSQGFFSAKTSSVKILETVWTYFRKCFGMIDVSLFIMLGMKYRVSVYCKICFENWMIKSWFINFWWLPPLNALSMF